jgi:predicted ATP-grasp superfamily ATP-dependent carboligase
VKLLIFEYITGGGFNQEPLPASLLAEGELMLRALLADCSRMGTLTLSVMLDSRCQAIAEAYAVTPYLIQAGTEVTQAFQRLLAGVDAVWLIAPEFAGILQGLTEQVEAAGKRLLGSSSAAVALTSNKWLTFQCLQAAAVPTVATALLAEHMRYRAGRWVIKPIDGVGCAATWRIDRAVEFAETLAGIDNLHHFIIQPFVAGQAMSLSCLFYQGQGWVLCVNEQVMTVQERCFKLQACKVNCLPVTPAHQQLVAQIAQAVPGLQGYVGIDFIEPTAAERHCVVEINPRLTSSYVGIYQALGLNIVELVLQLSEQPPRIQPVRYTSVDVILG